MISKIKDGLEDSALKVCELLQARSRRSPSSCQAHKAIVRKPHAYSLLLATQRQAFQKSPWPESLIEVCEVKRFDTGQPVPSLLNVGLISRQKHKKVE